MAEINADMFTDQTTETILVLPESSNQVNNITIIAPSGPVAGTVTVTAVTQSASTFGDVFEAPDSNSVVDVSDGLPHTYQFAVGTMLTKLKFTPSAVFAFSVKCSSAR